MLNRIKENIYSDIQWSSYWQVNEIVILKLNRPSRPDSLQKSIITQSVPVLFTENQITYEYDDNEWSET